MEFDRHFYLCPPDYLEFNYIINPWMKKSTTFSKAVAMKQWETLFESYENLIPKTHLHRVKTKEGLEELCFFGDSVFAYRNKALFSRFASKERYDETKYVIDILSKEGLEGERVPSDTQFEGSGETMLWKKQILVGYGQRSNKNIKAALEKTFNLPVVALELIDPKYYHLDTALFPINDNYIAVYEAAFSEEAKKVIRSLDAEILYLNETSALAFALNSISINNTIVLYYKADQFRKQLEKLNFDVLSLDVSEFIKFGGGLKCLTFQHYL